MKDIKFIAFDKNKGQMYDVKSIDFSLQRIYLSNGYGLQNENLGNGEMVMDGKNFSLLQYTGLKDKNGKEIYEGDVVNILYTDWTSQNNFHIGKVVWDLYQYVICFGKHPLGGDSIGGIIPGTHGWIEIIGNIYENPELLG